MFRFVVPAPPPSFPLNLRSAPAGPLHRLRQGLSKPQGPRGLLAGKGAKEGRGCWKNTVPRTDRTWGPESMPRRRFRLPGTRRCFPPPPPQSTEQRRPRRPLSILGQRRRFASAPLRLPDRQTDGQAQSDAPRIIPRPAACAASSSGQNWTTRNPSPREVQRGREKRERLENWKEEERWSTPGLERKLCVSTPAAVQQPGRTMQSAAASSAPEGDWRQLEAVEGARAQVRGAASDRKCARRGQRGGSRMQQ